MKQLKEIAKLGVVFEIVEEGHPDVEPCDRFYVSGSGLPDSKGRFTVRPVWQLSRPKPGEFRPSYLLDGFVNVEPIQY